MTVHLSTLSEDNVRRNISRTPHLYYLPLTFSAPRRQSLRPELSLWTSHNVAVPGDQLEIHCGSRSPQTSQTSQSPPEFNIKVNGRRVTGQRTSEERVEAHLALREEHFSSGRRRSGRRDWEDLVGL